MNDALGGYSLTLIDTLDTLAVSIYPFSEILDLLYLSPNSSYTYYLIVPCSDCFTNVIIGSAIILGMSIDSIFDH